MKYKEAPPPFVGYRVYGPRIATSGPAKGRAFVHLVGDGHRGSMSLARFNLSVHLGRRLEKDEHVDHINGDFTDDRVENLQILTQADNARKSHPGPTAAHGTLARRRYCKCQMCRDAYNQYMREWKKKKKAVIA